MKSEFIAVVLSFLCVISFKGFADDKTPIKVAHILGDTIFAADLVADQRFLKGYKRSYPNLSEEDVLDKMKAANLSSLIWKRIYHHLSKEHALEPTAEEVEGFINAMHRANARATSSELTPEAREASLKVYRDFVKTYKISKYLYETYGGTVIFQQGNPQEPVGAYRKLLEEYKAQGDFQIYNQQYEKAFWSYYLREHRYVIPQEKVDFSKPWWERAEAQ